VYRTQDGAIALGALTNANRDAIRRVLGILGQERSDDADFDAADPARAREVARWSETLTARFAERPTAQWLRELDAAGTPASAVQLPEEMADDPQVQADGMIADLTHDLTGPQRVVGPILKMSGTPTAAHRASPALGGHTSELLEELGCSATEISQLIAEGTVGQQ
jgi:crotonobetainyl-CoA:carnitine CoA-transferase CaiB-like acyl-CoA transferase